MNLISRTDDQQPVSGIQDLEWAGELLKHARDPLTYNDPLRVVVRKIQEYPAPVLAMIEGGVWGGACELAMACDMVIAAENATFAITPARLGVPCNLSGIQNMMGSVPLVVVKVTRQRAVSKCVRRVRNTIVCASEVR